MDFGDQRHLAYTGSQAVVITMNVNRQNWQRHAAYWAEDVREGASVNTPPIFLVGTMSDMRNDPLLAKESLTTFTREQGVEVAQSIGAEAYLETSAVTKEGIDEVLKTVVSMALSKTGRSAAAAVNVAPKAVDSVPQISDKPLLKKKEQYYAPEAKRVNNKGKKNKECILI
jgi:GTPase SAR1 family protein